MTLFRPLTHATIILFWILRSHIGCPIHYSQSFMGTIARQVNVHVSHRSYLYIIIFPVILPIKSFLHLLTSRRIPSKLPRPRQVCADHSVKALHFTSCRFVLLFGRERLFFFWPSIVLPSGRRPFARSLHRMPVLSFSHTYFWLFWSLSGCLPPLPDLPDSLSHPLNRLSSRKSCSTFAYWSGWKWCV